MIIKEMEYKSTFETAEVLAFGFYKNHRYWAVSRGMHPCCYIELLKRDEGYKKGYDYIKLAVHCGLTYAESSLDVAGDEEGWFIGWDYGHCGDFSGLFIDSVKHALVGKKWTSEDLERDCIEAIDQLQLMVWK